MHSSVDPISISKQSLVRSLASKKMRRKRALFLVEGERIVSEALAEADRVKFVYGTDRGLSRLKTLPLGIEALLVEEPTDLFLTDEAQGIGAVIAMQPILSGKELLSSSFPTIWLDQVRDPGNAGTIIRSADWFGPVGLLFSVGSVDPWNPKGVRASMGGILRVPIAVDCSPELLLGKNEGELVGLDMSGEPIDKVTSLSKGSCYVVGSEATGLSPQVRSACDRLISIPSRKLSRSEGAQQRPADCSVVESLNAGVSAAILMWELARR